MLMRSMVQAVNSPGGCAIQAFMFDNSVDKDLIRLVKTQVSWSPGRQLLIDALARGRDRGEVRADAVDRAQPRWGPH